MTSDEKFASSIVESFAQAPRRDWSANDWRLHKLILKHLGVLLEPVAPEREEPQSADDVLFMLGEAAGPGQEPTPEMAREIWALMEGETRFTIAVRAWERGKAVAALRAPVAPDGINEQIARALDRLAGDSRLLNSERANIACGAMALRALRRLPGRLLTYILNEVRRVPQ